MAELVITIEDGRTRALALAEGIFVIGRDPTCDLQLDQVGVSRRHAQIRRLADGYVIEDLGSKNGTLVNGETVRSVRLRDGDVAVCGTQTILFRDGLIAPSTTSVLLSDLAPAESSTRYASPDSDLVLSQRRLKVLYDLSDRLTRLRESNELLDDAMDVCFEMFRFERGAIGVCPTDRRGVDWPVIRNALGAEGELTISRSIVARALERGERAVIIDADMAQVDPTVSMVQHGIRSALCVPLEYRGQILGVIYGDRVSSGASYSEEDVDFLAGLARQVSIGLMNARLHEEQKLKLQLESEIALARDIQQRLFPASLPDSDTIHIAALNEPGRAVSGDYYDVIDLHAGKIGFLIADVSGKGVASSLLMANLQAAVRVTLDTARGPGEQLGAWNRLIHRNTDPGKFVTCLLAVIDPVNRTATLANAGHHLPYKVVADRSKSHELRIDNGLPLGIDALADYPTGTIDLGPEPCTLFMYTDGVIEAMNADDELFEWSRTLDAIHQDADLNPHRMVKRVRSAISKFVGRTPQSDDITMLAIHLP